MAYADIGGATSQSYTPVADDIGYRLRCKVLAHNAIGDALSPATSNASDAVVVGSGVKPTYYYLGF